MRGSTIYGHTTTAMHEYRVHPLLENFAFFSPAIPLIIQDTVYRERVASVYCAKYILYNMLLFLFVFSAATQWLISMPFYSALWCLCTRHATLFWAKYTHLGGAYMHVLVFRYCYATTVGSIHFFFIFFVVFMSQIITKLRFYFYSTHFVMFLHSLVMLPPCFGPTKLILRPL